MSRSVLESMTNMFGRVKRAELAAYAELVGYSLFLEQVRDPCLLGVARFAGAFIGHADHHLQVKTMRFNTAPHGNPIAEEHADVGGIQESLYPLVVSSEQASAFKQFRIGRGSTNDIVIPDYSISGEHAIIYYERQRYRMEDLFSTNGSTVDGQPVFDRKVDLHDGARIKLGRFLLLLVWPSTLYRLLIPESEPEVVAKRAAVSLDELTDAVGRFDLPSLRAYCREYSQEELQQLLVYPVLAGAAFLSGNSADGSEEEEHTTPTPPAAAMGKKYRPLAGMLFPVAKNPASAVGAEESFLIGRSARADLRMNEPTISKQHARLEWRENQLWLVDLGSANGTTLNNRPLLPQVARVVRAGDRVSFGKNEFVFLSPERLHAHMQAWQD
ncbi:FHA domain-containing protein [Candidatus Magnetaquicoccus inordinatus]|uniref:FHA domain-containing protein n=1 Tax=Candidatus Magnetaquicoccus inordinatus TaxID=2496818 RepID=UPI00187D27BE|nr:FHA domain-containing protein [Candidatus Magnetaquicoccus inordinatus]